METPIKVFIAATPSEWLPARVLEFSVQETASVPVSVQSIHGSNRPIPIPASLKNRPRTPFSFQRFLIPELCEFTGRAIYLDADMLVFRDIMEIWQQDLTDCDLQTVMDAKRGRRKQFSVMLLNCETLHWNLGQIVADLDAGKMDYAGLMYEMRVAKRIRSDIPTEWNSLEHFEAGKTALLHYTDMSTQPWIYAAHPLGHLWLASLRRALKSGFITHDELKREIEQGHVRPSLLAQIETERDNLRAGEARKFDEAFRAPYLELQTAGKSSPWTSRGAALRASLLRAYDRIRLAR
jgi:lipopolysaccharide biosynthesis glycosyltransferase